MENRNLMVRLFSIGRLLLIYASCWLNYSLAWAADMADVVLDVPPAFREKLDEAMRPLVATARLEDDGDVAQLLRRLRPVLRDVLGTDGYFAPRFTRTPAPDNSLRLYVKVEPGEQVIVKELDIQFRGAIAEASQTNQQRRELLKSLWTLPTGSTFNQKDWAASKQALLNQLLAKDYPAASIVSSAADIDSEEKSARLSVTYDSGRAFTLGELEVVGLNKFRGDLVARFNTIRPGEQYDQERLLGLQADLQNTSYFSSVSVDVDTATDDTQQVPIHVEVKESQTRRVGFGAGVSSNTGVRTELSYRNQNFLNNAYALVSGIRLEQRRQTVYSDLFLPPKSRGQTDSIGLSLDRLNTQGLTTERAALGAIRRQVRGDIETQWGINIQREGRRIDGQSTNIINALVGSGSWTRRRVDDALSPRSGHVLTLQVAGALEALLAEQNFARLYGRYQRYWAWGRQNVLTLRTEFGSVLSNSQEGIPQEFLFRAGGTNSVRGFPYLGLGVSEQGALLTRHLNRFKQRI